MAMTADAVAAPTKARLWTEFAALYLAVPTAIAVFLPPRWLFPALFAVTAVGMVLLARTPGFRWASLGEGWREVRAKPVAIFAGLTLAASLLVVLDLAPEMLFGLPRSNPVLWLLVLLLYPVLSALPQELLFRPLFFRRYGALLPRGWPRVVLNASAFALAHLMYWNVVVGVMTFAGGLVFAVAYEVRRSFPLAVVLHAVAGWILFTIGLGIFFYSGNITRPF